MKLLRLTERDFTPADKGESLTDDQKRDKMQLTIERCAGGVRMLLLPAQRPRRLVNP